MQVSNDTEQEAVDNRHHHHHHHGHSISCTGGTGGIGRAHFGVCTLTGRDNGAGEEKKNGRRDININRSKCTADVGGGIN